MVGKVYGVDLGTSLIKIYKKGKGIVVSQRNIIAIENKKRLLAVGDEAYDMYEKAPESVVVSQPIRNGVIADIANMERLFSEFMKQTTKTGKLQASEYIVAIPIDITEVEKRAFVDLIEGSQAKVKRVRVVPKPIAACVGAGLNVNDARGIMMVDIGASTTEISVISLGGIVISDLISIGGDTFNEAIITAMKKKFNLLIGNKTAFQLKRKLGNIERIDETLTDSEKLAKEIEKYLEQDSKTRMDIDSENREKENLSKEQDICDTNSLNIESVKEENIDTNIDYKDNELEENKEIENIKEMKVYGRNFLTGLPQQVTVTSDIIVEAMKEPLESIMEAIKRILERTPPELSSDIIDSGIYISGGSATIKGIDKMVHDHTGLNVNVCDDPENAVVRGLGEIIENPSLDGLVSQYVK